MEPPRRGRGGAPSNGGGSMVREGGSRSPAPVHLPALPQAAPAGPPRTPLQQQQPRVQPPLQPQPPPGRPSSVTGAPRPNGMRPGPPRTYRHTTDSAAMLSQSPYAQPLPRRPPHRLSPMETPRCSSEASHTSSAAAAAALALARATPPVGPPLSARGGRRFVPAEGGASFAASGNVRQPQPPSTPRASSAPPQGFVEQQAKAQAVVAFRQIFQQELQAREACGLESDPTAAAAAAIRRLAACAAVPPASSSSSVRRPTRPGEHGQTRAALAEPQEVPLPFPRAAAAPLQQGQGAVPSPVRHQPHVPSGAPRMGRPPRRRVPIRAPHDEPLPVHT